MEGGRRRLLPRPHARQRPRLRRVARAPPPRRFARRRPTAGVERVVYLGGLGPDQGGSPHLDSRHHTAEALRRCGPAADLLPGRDDRRPGQRVLRAAALDRRQAAGAARAGLAALGDPADRDPRRRRLPPRGARRCPSRPGREIQIGGPTSCSTSTSSPGMPRRPAAGAALRIPLPDGIASPGVVAAGAAAVTSGSPAVAAELSLGLRDDTSVTDPSGAAPVRHPSPSRSTSRSSAPLPRRSAAMGDVVAESIEIDGADRDASGTSSWTRSGSANG